MQHLIAILMILSVTTTAAFAQSPERPDGAPNEVAEPASLAPSPTATPATVSDSQPATPIGPLFGPGVGRTEEGNGLGRGLAGNTFSLWRYLGSMLVMLGLFGGAIYLLNRWRRQHLGSDPARAMMVTGRLPVGGKQSVVLVRVRGEEVLIGLSPDRMDVLGRYALLDEEALEDDLIPEAEAEPLAPQPLQKISNWP